MQKHITIKKFASILVIMALVAFANAPVAFGESCVGNNWEQPPPVPDVSLPNITDIIGNMAVAEGKTTTLTASATVDAANGGVADFFWCAEAGLLECNPDYADCSRVFYTAPLMDDVDGIFRVSVQAGDSLGYVDIHTIEIDVLDVGEMTDSDGDGLPDSWEMEHFGTLAQDATTDYDLDGIPDIEEYNLGFDPTIDDANVDSDNDGYSNLDEYTAGTDAFDPDDHPLCAYSVPTFYADIQSAIDAAYADGGGEVCVSPGTYYENLTLKDAVWLTAEGDPANTIIDGGGTHDVVVVHGAMTGGIIGFTIQNSGQNGQFAGVKCVGNETLTIANCVIQDNNHGIKLGGSASPLVVNNVIARNAGDGIHAVGNPPATIMNNIIVNNGGQGVSSNGKLSLIVDYNDLWDNAGDQPKSNNGNPKNNKEDAPLGEGNIAEDPFFMAPTAADYRLAAGSPAIDAGHPDFTDEDGTRSDMGAYGGQWRDMAEADETPAPGATLNVTLDTPDADLTVFDPEERECGKDGSNIPGAQFLTDDLGRQTVVLPELKSGNYRFVVKGKKDAAGQLTVTTLKDDAEIAAETLEVEVKAHRSARVPAALLLSDDGAPRFVFGRPNATKKPDGAEMKGDVNADGKVDIGDVMKAASKWDKKQGDEEFDEFYDFDGDGDIDMMDIMQIAGDWYVP